VLVLSRRGFTMVELMIVIGLLGLLISISVPSMQGYLRANRFDT
jgi:prepilin-type N-terminal cleavage/methylation domain-containing protein